MEKSCYEEETAELTNDDFNAIDLHKGTLSYNGTDLLTSEVLKTVYAFLEEKVKEKEVKITRKKEIMQAI